MDALAQLKEEMKRKRQEMQETGVLEKVLNIINCRVIFHNVVFLNERIKSLSAENAITVLTHDDIIHY